MFFSTTLLSRKTPIGAIWILAHGKRLGRNAILSICIVDACRKIMEPDVPHSLRLQSILIGGLVIAFQKQQRFLLDDIQKAQQRFLKRGATTEIDRALNEPKTKVKRRVRKSCVFVECRLMAVTNLKTPDARLTIAAQLPFTFFDNYELCPALQQDDNEFEPVPTTSGELDCRVMQLLSEIRGDQSMIEAQRVDPEDSNFNHEIEIEMEKDLPPLPEMEMIELNNMNDKDIQSKELTLMSLDEQEFAAPLAQSIHQELHTPEKTTELQHTTKKSARSSEVAPRAARKRIKLLKVDDVQGLQIGAKKYKKWMNSTEDWIVYRPKKKQKRWNIEELLLPHQPIRRHPAVTQKLYTVFEDLITLSTKPQEPATSIKQVDLANEPKTPLPDTGFDGEFMDAPVMDLPMRDELMMTEPDRLIQSQTAGSIPSQIDKLRAALSSPVTQNLDLGKTPGSSAQPIRNEGSDLSSLLASRHTNVRGTPGTGQSLSQTCNSEQPLLPILEEEHHSGQENINTDFLPETHLVQSCTIRETGIESNKSFVKLPFSDSTLAVVECLKQKLEEDSWKGNCTSLFQLTQGLTRLEVSKLFYQICVIKFHDYIGTYQAETFSDIIISQGRNM